MKPILAPLLKTKSDILAFVGLFKQNHESSAA